jgi:RimJ/RimL family protein N-acetyltransferase
MFEKHPEPLAGDHPDWGRIALLPWDTETFGFGVADYEINTPERERLDPSSIYAALEAWVRAHDVQLVGTQVPASDSAALYFFHRLGFRHIETTLAVQFDDVQKARYDAPREILLAPAGEPDLADVLRISRDAFHHGRYHADARVPRDLADQRYQDWVRRTLRPRNPQVLLAARSGAEVCGFSVVEIHSGQGYLHLYAVDPSRTGAGIGVSLVAATLRYVQERGAGSMRSKISAANVASINIMARLGARFLDPLVLLHWHAPGSARPPRLDPSTRSEVRDKAQSA